MYIELDLSKIPPVLSLHEPDEFRSFEVRIRGADESFIAPETVTELAGDRAQDPTWQDGFRTMLEYAAARGWTNASGEIQAHIES